MSFMLSALMIVQVLSALAIIVLVLLQQGKGADMGSAFGTGSAGSLFGASGAANFLSRTTKWAAVVFFVTTAGLAYVTHKGVEQPTTLDSGVMSGYQAPADKSVPQAPGGASVPAPATQGDASVPGSGVPSTGGAAPAQTAPAKPDASVPQAPAAPATPAAPVKPATPAK
ncbi:preprotein translocase subunit SecG [Bordetella genomosp. 8]|uniref:Protein-export membrane protein SecG n=1 Tax=Bordetella genomosp. 8 TaxID=1416806 RepID=A0A1W6YP35_9BORD|nr:preprotein translocase subunit SecG [Bordetella genomosp. 8]ARP82876.1 preprotein translocase subunit SecG [Bordetella genomosp. 8]